MSLKNLNQNVPNSQKRNEQYTKIKRFNKGILSKDGKYVSFDIRDFMKNIFKNAIKIEKELLLKLPCFDKEKISLNFDIFYNKQKGSKNYQPMYYNQPYEEGFNLQPLKSLLFPNFSRKQIWCFVDGDRFNFSRENVYTIKKKLYNSLSGDKKPVTYDENKLFNTQETPQYNINEKGSFQIF
jgi:hypothetical protein